MADVDVVVPCYNYGHYLKRCVDSVLSQRGVDVRILIIDDKSPDNTEEIGRGIAARESSVEFRRHAVNKGLIDTANEGLLGWARAPYVLLLSADDLLVQGALARAVEVLQERPDIAMVYGMAQIIGGREDQELQAPEQPTTPTYKVIDGSRFIRFCCKHGNPVASPTAVLRNEFLRRTGGYCPAMPHTSDMEMWLRVATRGSIGVIKETQGYYRMHGNNMSAEYTSKNLGDLGERIATCRYVYSQWGKGNVAGFDAWMAEMMSSAAREAAAAAGVALEAGRISDYRHAIAFADKMDPLWRRSSYFPRLLLKRWIGGYLWKKLRVLVRALGRESNATNSPIISSWRVGDRYGWWPEDAQLH
jgi:glycosyltransferase involved in cell wall biosynthesis